MKLKKIICALCLVVSSFSFTSCQNNNGPLIEKDSLIGLPNHDYILNINNKNNEQLTIQPSDYSLMQYSVLSPTSFKSQLIKGRKRIFRYFYFFQEKETSFHRSLRFKNIKY